MIYPDKHMNLKVSVLNISAFILGNVKTGQEVQYNKLLDKTISKLGQKSKENFPYALNFLFLLGKIKYISEADSITIE